MKAIRCPICGAKCKCRKRGENGICCSCHKHKPRAINPEFALRTMTPDEREAFKRHEQVLEQSGKRYQKVFEFKQG